MKKLCLLLFGLLVAASAHAQPASVHVDGGLRAQELRLLEELSAMGVPLPDTVRTRQFALHGRGWWKPLEPQTVHLSPSRAVPYEHVWQVWPYLVGARAVTGRHRAHTLAHEISHFLAVKMDPEMGRPALGLTSGTDEVQAEIMALVLEQQVFGTTAAELGYPSVIEYPSDQITDKSTARLRWKYCLILRASWALPFGCTRPFTPIGTE